MEGRSVYTYDVPNAYVQQPFEHKDGERAIMKIKGALVDMLVEIDPTTYADFVVFENGQKVLYTSVLKAIYDMLESALILYKRWRGELEARGYVINPYDPCVANKMINGSQHTVVWHVDDCKASHKDPLVNEAFVAWVNDVFGSDEMGHVKTNKGKRHRYLGMDLDFSKKGKVIVDMIHYVDSMIEDFPEDVSDYEDVESPAPHNLMEVNQKSPLLDKAKAKRFHTTVA